MARDNQTCCHDNNKHQRAEINDTKETPCSNATNDCHTGEPILQVDNLTSTYVLILFCYLVTALADSYLHSCLCFSFMPLTFSLVLVSVIIPELS